jgi:hypothetical protein
MIRALKLERSRRAIFAGGFMMVRVSFVIVPPGSVYHSAKSKVVIGNTREGTATTWYAAALGWVEKVQRSDSQDIREEDRAVGYELAR